MMDVELLEYLEKRKREFREAQESHDNQEGCLNELCNQHYFIHGNFE